MSFDFFTATNGAWLLLKFASTQAARYNLTSVVFARVALAIFSQIASSFFPAFRCLKALFFIASNFLELRVITNSDIMLGARFAFIQMAVGHFWMLVKLGEFFDLLAFETAFQVHDSYDSCGSYEVN